MQNLILILFLGLLPLNQALNCQENGRELPNKQEAIEEVMNYLLAYAKVHPVENETLSREHLMEEFKNVEFKDKRSEALLCQMLGSSNGWFVCKGCEAVIWTAGVFAGKDGAKLAEDVKTFINAACKKLNWLPPARKVCIEYIFKVDMAAYIIENTIRSDNNNINPEHICTALTAC